MTAPAAPTAGFYPDPLDPSGERWWDGVSWTEAVRPTGAAVTGAALTEPAVTEAALTEAAATDAAHDRTVPAPDVVPPGFYPDPYGEAAYRWWDGAQWTAQVHPGEADQAGAAGAAAVPNDDSDEPGAAPAAPETAAPVQTVLPATSGRPAPVPVGRGLPAASRLRRRFRIAAAALVLVAGVAGRVYLLLDDADTPGGATPQHRADAVNLRVADLPAGWRQAPAKPATGSSGATSTRTRSASTTTSSGADDAAIARCIGAADAITATLADVGSPTFVKGSAQLSSDVSVARTSALAQQDLRALRGSKLTGCVTRIATPSLRRQLAPNHLALTALSVTRITQPADGFGFRMRMTVRSTAQGSAARPVTLYTDSYGFVRGPAQVGLTVMSASAPPDHALVERLLTSLRTRAGKQFQVSNSPS